MQDTQTQEQATKRDLNLYSLTKIGPQAPTAPLEPGKYVAADERGIVLALVLDGSLSPRDIAAKLRDAANAMDGKLSSVVVPGEWWNPTRGEGDNA